MNKELALAIEHGIDAGKFDRTKGFCLRVMRQGTEDVVGTKYDFLFRGDGSDFPDMPHLEALRRDATATRAGHRFVAAGLGFRRADLAKHGGLQAGDMLVKTNVAPNRWGDMSGHIGAVMVDLKRVGENSSTSIGRVKGALGYRTLSQFGDYQLVIRIPPRTPVVHAIPVKAPVADEEPLIVVWNGNPYTIEQIIERGGHVVTKVTEKLDAKRVYVQSTPNGANK